MDNEAARVVWCEGTPGRGLISVRGELPIKQVPK